MNEMIPYKPASREQKAIFEGIMIEGNEALKRWHEKAKAKLGRKRYSRSDFRKELLKVAIPHQPVHIFGFQIPKSDMEKIQRVKDIEWDILCAYSRMVGEQAHRWSVFNTDVASEFSDLYEEGVCALMQAIICYTGSVPVKSTKTPKRKRRAVTFMTYGYVTVRRRLISICTRTTPFSRVPHVTANLVMQFEITKQKMNRPANFEEVINEMDLKPRQRKVLEAMLVTVIHDSEATDLVFPNDGDHHAISDYSTYSEAFAGPSGDATWRVQGHRGRLCPLFKEEESAKNDLDLQRAIQDTMGELSDLERSVLKNLLEDTKHGWMTRCAEENNVSRMAITYALRRVKDKLQQVYSSKAA